MQRLILFDLDGTLTRTQNGYLPFNEAVLQTFGVAGDIRSVVPDGNTDPQIVREIFVKAKVERAIDDRDWEQFAENLRRSYSRALGQGAATVRALPGAKELLGALAAKEEFSQGVVTGNFEVTARVKLEAAGLHSYLCRGAYGSDSHHRPDLPRIAKARWEKSSGRLVRAQHCVIIGDTPKDLHAARQNQMKCVLVGTGRYPVEELQYWKPDACLPDLTDTLAVVRTLANL
ncbi:MAG TPA: HAD family hydrolase [Candidatus Binatia bacterium]|nr:HAD family hydrolase [Candidatus Binatia bacterium]